MRAYWSLIAAVLVAGPIADVSVSKTALVPLGVTHGESTGRSQSWGQRDLILALGCAPQTPRRQVQVTVQPKPGQQPHAGLQVDSPASRAPSLFRFSHIGNIDELVLHV